ncbi:LPXTG cell wall anchor domain-containing protein, partial [Blautia wexlerae]
LTQATTTPGANGTNGDGTGSGDGTTDGGTTDVTPTTYADGTNGTAKSAVSTGDESPVGTMLALAAASVLAGGYVLIRRRKKEM